MSKALKSAIDANDPDKAKAALKTIKDLGRKLPKADAPLAYACTTGADRAVPILLQAGAPLPPDDAYPGTHPFALAADAGHPAVLRAFAAHAQIPAPIA